MLWSSCSRCRWADLKSQGWIGGSASETPSRSAGSSARRVRSCCRMTSFGTSRETRVPKLRGERIKERTSTVLSAQVEALPGSFLAFTMRYDHVLRGFPS